MSTNLDTGIKKNKKALKIREINIFLVIVSFLFCFLILSATAGTFRKYKNFTYSMNDFSDCTKAVSDFQKASNFLTDQVRLFVHTHDINHVNNYFDELNNFCRREASIQIVGMTHYNDSIDVNLKMALQESDALMERELYAMKLICEAKNYPDEIIPSEIKSVSLLSQDEALSSYDKIEKAQSLVFGRAYLSTKNRIDGYASAANGILVTQYLADERSIDSEIRKSFYLLLGCIFALLSTSVILFFILNHLILKPLYHHLYCINNDEKMEEKGAYEVQYVARAYNLLWEKNIEKRMKLKHKAEHDALTGLYNRAALGDVKRSLTDTNEKVAYFLIDLDSFKQINDNYGHHTGDEVIKFCAKQISEIFRSSDCVARVGGDEFAVIMTKIDDTIKEVVSKKIKSINEALLNPDKDIPPVSISVGVAVSEKGYSEELSRQADAALYKVKESGKAGFAFYEQEDK